MARRWQEDWAAGSTAVAKTSSSDDYVRFDEIKDVLASVDLIALLAPLVGEKPLHWKWMIVGAHDALQGAMVCAFADSTETSILENKSAAAILSWFNAGEDTRGKYPDERLASFGELLDRCIAGRPDFEPLVLKPDQLKDIERLHDDFRNHFAHFTPKGWGIEKVGLPRIIEATLDVVKELMNRGQVTRRMEVDQRERLDKTLKTAKLALPS
jgi:hypothetical protein